MIRTIDPIRRYALVTGASSGIGRAVAIELADRGWGTFLLARRTALLEDLAASLRPKAPSFVITADLADPDETESAVHAILGHGLRLSLVINNAGFGLYRPFLGHSHVEHQRLMQVNYFAPLRLIASFLPHMLERGGGHFINILSMSAKLGPWGHTGYAASKAALRALGESLEAEYAPRGVNFSGVFPGLVATPYFESAEKSSLRRRMSSRMISAESCAQGVCRVVDHPRVSTCMPRHYRLLDFISAAAPGFAHRLVTLHSRDPEQMRRSVPAEQRALNRVWEPASGVAPHRQESTRREGMGTLTKPSG